MYAKYPSDDKCQFLINKKEKVGSKQLNDSIAFIEYSNDIQGVHKNIDEYNLG